MRTLGVVAGAGSADWDEQAGGGQLAQVALGLLEGEVLGLLVSRAPDPADDGDVVQRGEDSFVQSGVSGERGEQLPHSGGLVHPMLDCLCLLVVGGQAEPDPTGYVLVGLVGGAAALELLVILPGVTRPAREI